MDRTPISVLTRSLFALITAAGVYFLAYLGVWLAWFGISGANFKIGPSDLGVPLIVFSLVTTGIAAAAAGLVVGWITTRDWSGSALVVGGTVVVNAVVVGIYVLAFEGDPDQTPVHVFVPALTAVILSRVVARRSKAGDIPDGSVIN